MLRPTLGDMVMLSVLVVSIIVVAGWSLAVVATPAIKLAWLVYAAIGVVLIRDRLRRMSIRSRVPSAPGEPDAI